MKFRFLFFALAAVYPFIVFIGLVVLKVPLRIFSLAVIIFGLLFFFSATGASRAGAAGTGGPLQGRMKKPYLQAVLLSALGLLCLITNIPLILRLYPVLVSAVLLGAFGSTLFFPPSFVYRLAVLMDRSIPGSLAEEGIVRYCRRVNIIWCVFFFLNSIAAALTVFLGSEAVWVLYNGGIFYGLIAIFFAVEYMVRRMVKKKLPRAVPLSRVTPAARKKDTVLCYSGSYGGGLYRTWGDFLAETAALRSFIEREKERRWILYGGDYWFFLIAYTALLQCKREVLLTANISPGYLGELAGDAVLITDEQDALPLVSRSFYIPELLAREAGAGGSGKDRAYSASSPVPPIRADETVIVMYTSGTTGEPKQVVQRLTEFEKDNDFILSRWGGEFLKRKLCSTVGPHHIYGLLFSVMLPFTAGIPFRRERIEFPETFETLKDDSYMIITVPALLKRSVENREVPFGLKDPWIFTSGGVLPFEIAAQTEKLFGFWPLEVYGSTETSGIAWRQSKAGPEWTPFSNAELWKNDEGCLVIKSPYIKDPAGFTTGDLAELLDGGRFLLKGRADSIVKIEEKRISLPEIESRLLRSGLVSDAAAAALQGKRQYLAAALVLNKEGRKRFEGMEKFRINRYFREYLGDFFEPQVIPRKWRYLDALPRDAQGKLQKGEIGALFRDPPGPARSGEEDGAISAADAGAAVAAVPSAVLAFPGGVSGTLLERSQNPDGLPRAVFELSVPGDSPYFDGHFPQFKLLPAVAQIELVLACASFILGPSLISGAKRLKFSGAVFPDTKVLVEIDWALRDSGNTLRYALSGPGGRSCSSGVLCLESAGGPL